MASIHEKFFPKTRPIVKAALTVPRIRAAVVNDNVVPAAPVNRSKQIDDVLNFVCRKHGVSRELLRTGRVRYATDARQEAAIIMHEQLGMGVCQVARRLDRDHFAIINYLRHRPRNTGGEQFVAQSVDAPDGADDADDIIDLVCHKYGISRSHLLGDSFRVPKIALARQEAALLMYRDLGMSSPQIAPRLNRSASSILDYVQAAESVSASAKTAAAA
jgi:chromosomal replication initiation ATPase DnaA